MKSIVFFWGSKLEEQSIREINIFLDELLQGIKSNIESVIYWWWTYWVMWIIKEKVELNGIELQSFSMEKYKKETDPKWTKYFSDENERIKEFFEKWTHFIWLPWWIWTITEILIIWNLIRASNDSKQIFIPEFFRAFYKLIETLEKSWMLADIDTNIFNRIQHPNEIIRRI